MGFVPTGRKMDDIPEEAPVPEGEYDLRVVQVREGKSASGRTTIKCTIAVEDPNFPAAQPVTHVLTIPTDEDWENESRTANMMMRNNKRFLRLFGVEWGEDGFDTEDLENGTAKAFLSAPQEADDGNFYNRIRLPRIKE